MLATCSHSAFSDFGEGLSKHGRSAVHFADRMTAVADVRVRACLRVRASVRARACLHECERECVRRECGVGTAQIAVGHVKPVSLDVKTAPLEFSFEGLSDEAQRNGFSVRAKPLGRYSCASSAQNRGDLLARNCLKLLA
eukprot:6205615-Pleurochrysis_carterae.AAC.2